MMRPPKSFRFIGCYDVFTRDDSETYFMVPQGCTCRRTLPLLHQVIVRNTSLRINKKITNACFVPVLLVNCFYCKRNKLSLLNTICQFLAHRASNTISVPFWTLGLRHRAYCFQEQTMLLNKRLTYFINIM